VRLQAMFEDQDINTKELADSVPESRPTSFDGEMAKSPLADRIDAALGTELALEDLADVLSGVMSREGAQPDFAVTDVGVIPAAHDGGQPTLVWVTAPEQPLAPHGFGNKVAMHRFWQVPEEVTSQLAPGLEDPKLRQQFVHNMYYKAERANMSDSAAYALNMMIESFQMSRAFSLVCGPDRSSVVAVYTLLAPRPTPSFLTTPLLLFEVEADAKEPLLRGQVAPDVAQQLGTPACLCRTIVAETEDGWYEVSVTSPELDVFSFKESGNPVHVTPISANMCKQMNLQKLFEFAKEWPGRLRDSSSEEIVAPSGSIGIDADVEELAQQGQTYAERTFFQALNWGRAAQDELGVAYRK